MKSITAVLLLILTIGTINGADLESYQYIDRLLGLPGPGAPEIYEDSVIFTAPSSYRRVGIAFAFEGYARVHWFRKLLIPRDPAEIAAEGKKKNVELTRDSGLLFHVQTVPDGIKNLDYRMIIDGLWTQDPLNPLWVTAPSGLTQSRVAVPDIPRPIPAGETSSFKPDGILSLSYTAPPGETVTVAGNFNSWDPFMYEMRETNPGSYNLSLSLPPGIYQYVFFHRGERILDPHNRDKVYSLEGKTASQAVVK
ncbi:MAG: isoamylase [Treponema sp.]|nr:isoamylase [Treponema sp.]